MNGMNIKGEREKKITFLSSGYMDSSFDLFSLFFRHFSEKKIIIFVKDDIPNQN